MLEQPWMADSPELEVRVAGGVVRGVREGDILAWRGIPYASAPIGPLRFRAPQPVTGWEGVRDASRFGKAATQVWRGQFRGVSRDIPSGEDCLTLNVLAPVNGTRADAEVGLPVMVFIHGGGYCAGSSRDFSGQGEGFVTTGQVVYVSFNYRLGALGYLDLSRYSTPDRPFESNLGLRDQVAVLEWVSENISAFGGDPTRVTLFGESAGGNAVTTLMATPAARGLFAGAIAQSSPADSVFSRELASRWAEEFVEALRTTIAVGDLRSADPVRLLTEATAAELVAAALILQLRTPDDTPGTYPLAPVVDGDFVPERPLTAFRSGRAHRVPLIIGTNDREGSIFRGRIDIIPRTLARIRPLFQQAPALSRERMRDAYPGLPRPRPAADFGGDFAFWYPTLRVAQSHSRYAPVHVYRFDFAPRLMHLVGLDATHGIEMLALFDRTGEPAARTMTALGGRDPFFRAGARMRRHWLHFAVSGTLPDGWPGYSESDRHTLIIDSVDRIETDPRTERRLAWEAFLPDPE